MSNMRDRLFALGASLGLAGIVGWLIWGKLLGWIFSQLPQHSEYIGIFRIISMIGVGWCGGIAVPGIILAFGLYCFLTLK